MTIDPFGNAREHEQKLSPQQSKPKSSNKKQIANSVPKKPAPAHRSDSVGGTMKDKLAFLRQKFKK